MQKQILTPYTLDELHNSLIKPLKELIESLSKAKDPERPLSRKQASKYLGITLVTLNDWSKRGLINKHRVKGTNKVYYLESELLEAITQNKIQYGIRRK